MALGYNGRGIAMATALGFALVRHIGAGAPLDFPVTPIRPPTLLAAPGVLENYLRAWN